MYKSGMIDASTAMQMMADLSANSVSPPAPPAGGADTGVGGKKRPHNAVDQDDGIDSEMESIVDGAVGSHLVS